MAGSQLPEGGRGSASVCLGVCTIVWVPTVQICLYVLICVDMYVYRLASVCSIHVWSDIYACGFLHVPYAYMSCVIVVGQVFIAPFVPIYGVCVEGGGG